MYGIVALGLLGLATPASAQFTPRSLSDPATGETYHIEARAGFWRPGATMGISSESLGIVGSDIDFKRDLGLQDRQFSELHVTFRPAKKQKLFFQYIPIDYTQTATLTRNITFNGQLYRVGVPVNSQLNWKAYRWGYEYDAFYRSRGYVGFIIEAKYTDVKAQLESPLVTEFAHAAAPIPAIGGTGRFYFVPNISFTGQITGFKIPDSLSEDYKAHYMDYDFYGTINFNNFVGAQIGYRSLDVGYVVKRDLGDFDVKGFYFGIVARY
jgi:hypothetical protein